MMANLWPLKLRRSNARWIARFRAKCKRGEKRELDNHDRWMFSPVGDSIIKGRARHHLKRKFEIPF